MKVCNHSTWMGIGDRGETAKRGDVLLVLLRKSNGETYLFLFNREHAGHLLRTFVRFWLDSELSFTWHNLQACVTHARRQLTEAER